MAARHRTPSTGCPKLLLRPSWSPLLQDFTAGAAQKAWDATVPFGSISHRWWPFSWLSWPPSAGAVQAYSRGWPVLSGRRRRRTPGTGG